MAETLPLITKYRPICFEEVIGNTIAVQQLASAVKSNSRPHAYIFTGPSGVGKTTLARIIATEVEATILEIDAASNSGVDDTRALVALSGYKPITKEPSKLFIIDECHNLSDKGWEPLLKLIEEPPSFLYIALCTTEPKKVKDTILTRCYPVKLSTLRAPEIEDLVLAVAELEGWQLNNEILQAVVQASTGQPRKALSILQAGHNLQTREELAQVIAEIEVESSPLIQLCRYLIKGGKNWKQISQWLDKIEINDESLTIASRFITTTLVRSEEVQARELWTVAEALMTPRNGFDRRSHLIAAIGKVLWGNQIF